MARRSNPFPGFVYVVLLCLWLLVAGMVCLPAFRIDFVLGVAMSALVGGFGTYGVKTLLDNWLR